jgi:clan AA aspartic protease
MITGFVTARGEARISLRVRGNDSDYREISAIVDTGFTGSLTLTPTMIDELRLDWIGSEAGLLGNGSIVSFDVYNGTVLWHDEPRRIEVNASSAEALVGMELLRGYNLEIDVVDGGRVFIRDISDKLS